MSRWPGKLLDASSAEGRTGCELELREEALVALLPEGREVVLPLDTLALRRQGFSGDILAFHTEGTLEPVVTTRERALLDRLAEEPRGRRVLGHERARRRRAWARQVVLPIGLLASLVVAGSWFVLGPLVDVALAAIPTSVDAQLGELAFPAALEDLGGAAAQVHDARVVGPVRALLEPLVAQVPPGLGHRFEVHVVRHEMANAFALPGGTLLVTTGLLRRASSPEAVAGVLAHEVSHVTARHSVRSLLERVGLWALLAVAFGDVGGASTLILHQAAALTQLSFSRQMELEADRGGLELMRQAGLDPRGLQAFLQALHAGEAADHGPAFLSTHPASEERIRRLAELAPPGDAAPAPLPPDWRALQAALGEP